MTRISLGYHSTAAAHRVEVKTGLGPRDLIWGNWGTHFGEKTKVFVFGSLGLKHPRDEGVRRLSPPSVIPDIQNLNGIGNIHWAEETGRRKHTGTAWVTGTVWVGWGKRSTKCGGLSSPLWVDGLETKNARTGRTRRTKHQLLTTWVILGRPRAEVRGGGETRRIRAGPVEVD